MARVKNTMNVIQNTEINTYYDASVLNFQEIKRNSKGIFDLIHNSFTFGYAQGMKAAKAEIQRGGGITHGKSNRFNWAEIWKINSSETCGKLYFA